MSPFLKLLGINIILYSPKRWLMLLPFVIAIFSCNRKEADPADYSKVFTPVFNKTTHFFDFNQPDRAIKYLDSAFSHINNPSVNDKFRFYSLHYVYQQKVKHQYNLALLYADSMLMIAKNSVSRPQYVSNFAEGNYAKGDAYFNLKKFNEAYQCYFQGYVISKDYVNQKSLADYTYRMGMIMFKQAHYNLAANYFKESYSQSLLIQGPDRFPAFYRRQELLDNIGESYIYTGDIDSALVYFDKALKCVNDNSTKFKVRSQLLETARGVIYNNKGEALMILGRHNEAKELLKKSIAINLNKDGDNGDALLAEIKLGKIYLATNKNDSLFSLLGTIRQQLNTIKNEDAEADWNHLMGSYYLQKKNAAKAIAYIQEYNSLKDSTAKKLSSFKEMRSAIVAPQFSSRRYRRTGRRVAPACHRPSMTSDRSA